MQYWIIKILEFQGRARGRRGRYSGFVSVDISRHPVEKGFFYCEKLFFFEIRFWTFANSGFNFGVQLDVKTFQKSEIRVSTLGSNLMWKIFKKSSRSPI